MKTITLKLDRLNRGKEDKLFDLHRQVNHIAKLCLRMKKYNPDFSFYSFGRRHFPNLNSAILQDTEKGIIELLRSYRAKKKRNVRTNYPRLKNYPIYIRSQMYQFEGSGTEEFSHNLRLLRTNFPVVIGNKYQNGLLDRSIKFSDSKIVVRDKQILLKLTLKFEEVPLLEEGGVTGVDLGISRPAVSSGNRFYGNGKLIKHKKVEFQKKRSRNQKDEKVILEKQYRWQRDYNHKLSRQIVQDAFQEGTNVLVLEKLKGLGNRKFRKYQWAFAQLQEFIEYKARDVGIEVIQVNPAYSSQTCSVCGLKERSNRVGSWFQCNCGARLNSDLNAARNLSSPRWSKLEQDGKSYSEASS